MNSDQVKGKLKQLSSEINGKAGRKDPGALG